MAINFASMMPAMMAQQAMTNIGNTLSMLGSYGRPGMTPPPQQPQMSMAQMIPLMQWQQKQQRQQEFLESLPGLTADMPENQRNLLMMAAQAGEMGPAISGIMAAQKPPTSEYGRWREANPAATYDDWVRHQLMMKRAGASRTSNVFKLPGNIAPPEKGMQYVYDEEGRLSHAEPIPGSMREREIEAETKAAEGKEEYKKTIAGNVMNYVEKARGVAESNPRLSTGWFGQQLQDLGGSPAHNLKQQLEPIKSQIAQQSLQVMRENSPTGGALGNVSNFEVEMMQNSYGALMQSQSYPQFMKNLDDFENLYMDVIHGPGNRPQAPSSPDDDVIDLTR